MDYRTHFPPCKEIAVAIAIMAALAFGTVFTAEMFGHVTVDEVPHSDPAANSANNVEFIRTVWSVTPESNDLRQVDACG